MSDMPMYVRGFEMLTEARKSGKTPTAWLLGENSRRNIFLESVVVEIEERGNSMAATGDPHVDILEKQRGFNFCDLPAEVDYSLDADTLALVYEE